MQETAISTQAVSAIGWGRFQNLLSGKGRDHDQVLVEVHDCIVAPTLGSIVPNWLLIVPRQHAVSFRDWQAASSIDPVELVEDVLGELDVGPERAIWFEHGPAAAGSIIGCGVDHAHLHVLIDAPFSFDAFVGAATTAAPIDWRSRPTTAVYASLSAAGSYLLACSNGEAMAADYVESVGSQFFRRVTAELVGRPDEWNYKIHAHRENVQRTVSAFTQRALAIPL